MPIQWTIIYNPKACSGKGGQHWPQIERLLQAAGIPFHAVETQHAGHAILLAQQAIARGARHLVAVGGDGTMNELLNGIFGQEEVPPSEIVLSQIPIGTGNDWRRTVGIPKDYAACVSMLQEWRQLRQDVGMVEWIQDGQPRRRYFANVAGMGFEAAVGVKANADKAAGKGGVLGYVPALLGILSKYQCTQAAFKLDHRILPQRPFFSLAIGICKFNGGGMKQCPTASLDDGLFEMTIINQIPKYKVVANFPRIFTGAFVKVREVEQHQAATIEVVTGPETLLEVDGEDIGQGTAKFSLLPQALRVATSR